MVGRGQKNWFLHNNEIGEMLMAERLLGRVKFHGSSGVGAVGNMEVYKRR